MFKNTLKVRCKNSYTKFEVSSFSSSIDILGGIKFQSALRNPDHAHFRDDLSLAAAAVELAIVNLCTKFEGYVTRM